MTSSLLEELHAALPRKLREASRSFRARLGWREDDAPEVVVAGKALAIALEVEAPGFLSVAGDEGHLTRVLSLWRVHERHAVRLCSVRVAGAGQAVHESWKGGAVTGVGCLLDALVLCSCQS